jgi:hypothetical protein
MTHDDAAQSVGLLWTSDKLVVETSTWQHTTITTEKYPCPQWDSNPRSQQASGRSSQCTNTPQCAEVKNEWSRSSVPSIYLHEIEKEIFTCMCAHNLPIFVCMRSCVCVLLCECVRDSVNYYIKINGIIGHVTELSLQITQVLNRKILFIRNFCIHNQIHFAPNNYCNQQNLTYTDCCSINAISKLNIMLHFIKEMCKLINIISVNIYLRHVKGLMW